MKVAFLLGSLNLGGTETLLLDVFNNSVASPFEMFCVYRKEGTLSDDFHSSGVTLFKLTPGPVWQTFQYLWQLRKLLKEKKPDILHAQQCIDTIYAMLACLGLRIKVVQTFHGYDFNIGRFNRFLIRLSLRLADKNIFVSESQKRYYLESYKPDNKSALVKVYNGINFEKFTFKPESSFQSELSKEEKSLLLGMVGNFVPVRDQLTVCRFLKLLDQKGVDFTFVFIGEMDKSNAYLYNECRAFCISHSLESKILFLGPRSDVPTILPQLDAFIYASDHDTFGIAIIEAIASGIPVFVNDWEVMKEITDNGKRATLYRTKDEKDLLKKFLSFLEQSRTFKNAAIENARWAQNTYSIQNHIGSLYDVYCGIH